MRLLNTRSYELKEFCWSEVPKYAILSLRWAADETSYQDYRKGRRLECSGHQKVINACNFANRQGQKWLWVDTCCIDRRSSAELSEAINSMWKYYTESDECYVFMPDVRSLEKDGRGGALEDFRHSVWFSRGWTLQELIAPAYVIFCTSAWEVLGEKSWLHQNGIGNTQILEIVEDVTEIPRSVLLYPGLAQSRSVAERMSWAAKRETTRVEDMAYCLLGLFNINMPLLYGERERAFLRLQQEIAKSSLDESLWAWRDDAAIKHLSASTPSLQPAEDTRRWLHPFFAASPMFFTDMTFYKRLINQPGPPRFTVMDGGLIQFKTDDSTVCQLDSRTYVIFLRCIEVLPGLAEKQAFEGTPLIIQAKECGHFERTISHRAFSRLVQLQSMPIVDHATFYIHASPKGSQSLSSAEGMNGGIRFRPLENWTLSTLRLVNVQTYALEEFADGDVPPYAILSHRWTPGKEVLYHDYRKGRNCEGPGHDKIIRACDLAFSRHRNYIWIDTCCIDKRSSAELSEAVNSMHNYYAEALECYAYLADVPAQEPPQTWNEEAFLKSEWFTRGWTLQELLAPHIVLFFDAQWQPFGAKGPTPFPSHMLEHEHDRDLVDLNEAIRRITNIPIEVLRHPRSMYARSIAERMSWAANRVTTRIEDQAYCLLGLFEVNIPLLYGERHKAFLRLQREILLNTLDESIFAWTVHPAWKDVVPSTTSLALSAHMDMSFPVFAPSLHDFSDSTNVSIPEPGQYFGASPRFTLGGGGLVHFRPDDESKVLDLGNKTFIVLLRCFVPADDDARGRRRAALALRKQPCGHYDRLPFDSHLKEVYLEYSVLPQARLMSTVFHLHGATSRCS